MSSPQVDDLDDEPIDLRPYFATFWRYRRIIGLSIVAAAVIFALAATVVVLAAPTERVGMLQFRLLFAGADAGRYPNGVPFNAMEVIAPQVLSEVFTANSLDRYATLQEFQQSVSLLQSSPALEQLDAEYLPQFSNARLTVADRTRLQGEYLTKRDAVKDPQFDLTLRRHGRLTEMPAPLMETVLSDTVDTWARQADVQNGAARPDVDVVSRDMFARAADEAENYVVRITVIRTGAERILSTLTALGEVPGARAVRTASNRSLADEVAAVQDLLKIDLDTLMGLARRAGASPGEQVVMRAYLSDQLRMHRRALETASSRVRNLRSALRESMPERDIRVDIQPPPASAKPQGSAPTSVQLSETFLDRLMALSADAKGREFEYRRGLTDQLIAASEQATAAAQEIAYFEDQLRQVSGATPRSRTVGDEILSIRFHAVLDSLLGTVDRVHELYDALSASALNPSRRLYAVTRPFRLETFPSVTSRTLFRVFIFTMLATLVAALAGALIHNARVKAAPRTRQSAVEVGVI